MPTVADLRAELAALGESTTGLKAELTQRLDEAKKRTRPADGELQKASKQAKKAAAWFWAADKSPTEREWTPYPADAADVLEAAFVAGAQEEKAGPNHHVDLRGGGSPSAAILTFVQRSNKNPGLQRPVARTSNGTAPTQPPPKPVHVGGVNSAGAAAAGAPAPRAASGAAAGVKSIKAGGVSQVRYTSTGGASSSGGVRTEVVKGRAAVDVSCPQADSTHIYDDGKCVYDALLNQTDIGANKNKYYIIQLLETDASPPQYYAWNRWGRVGEERALQNACRGPMSLVQAKADFEGKFRDKTKNEWSGREQFKAIAGKYTLIERDYGSEDAPAGGASSSADDAKKDGGPPVDPKKPVESQLDPRVQSFMSTIADIRMMERSMREIGFDPSKMPLGKLKKKTIMDGYVRRRATRAARAARAALTASDRPWLP